MTTTYKVIAWNGHMKLISTYTESEARQLADSWASGKGGLKSFEVD